jgi:hypothetical protein
MLLQSYLPLGLHDSSRAWIDATRGCREPGIVAYGPLPCPDPVPSTPLPLLCQAVIINQRPLFRTRCGMVRPTHVFCFDYPFACSYGRTGRPIEHPTPSNQESNLFVLQARIGGPSVGAAPRRKPNHKQCRNGSDEASDESRP